MKLKPTVDGSGNGYRQVAYGWNTGGAAKLLAQLFQSAGLWATPGGVQAVQPLGFRIPNNGEQIAANTIACRFHKTKRCVSSDGGIDGAAAGLKYVYGDLAGQGLRCRSHSVGGINRAA